ncbi:unnamed protein product [Linum trigynum]|uniref:NLE domain-containing protein n=1 Tax=Linum trigynum TaxID=586398 RepID=A0AAV2DUP0_9ROSI
MEGEKISARFFTNSSDTSFNDTIPSTSTHRQLSTILNGHLESRNYVSKPYVFLIDGKLFPISLGLDKFLLHNGIYVNKKKMLEIEYTLPVEVEVGPLVHGGPVSAVDCSCPGIILTGCNDGKVRLWKDDGSCTQILEAHTGAIRCVSIINPLGKDATLVTASTDKTIKLWKMDSKEIGISPFKILHGHAAAGVRCVAANPSGSRFCSGSFEKTVKVWQTDGAASEVCSGSMKKMKTESGAKESQMEDNPVCSLEGHAALVSSVAWPVGNTIYSASWDCTIREWDVEKCSLVSTKSCGRPFSCLSVAESGSNILAAGGFDGKLRIYSPNQPDKSRRVAKFSSHNKEISACQWHKDSVHLLTASLDGTVMMWDVRNGGYAVIESHEHSVLCTDWWEGYRVISGGVDAKLRISSSATLPLKEPKLMST